MMMPIEMTMRNPPTMIHVTALFRKIFSSRSSLSVGTAFHPLFFPWSS
jgi:hypothetical protein